MLFLLHSVTRNEKKKKKKKEFKSFSPDNNQELLQLMIISFTLMTLMPDSGVILWGEIRC